MSDLTRLFGLAGQRALITGPTRGIGLAIARLFASAGAELVLAGDERAACDTMALELGAVSLPTDVADPSALEQLAAQAGAVDVLVCNAAIAGQPGPMHLTSEKARQHLMAVNLDHPIRLTGLIAPGMAARGGGSIVLMASIAGLRGNAAIGHYGISKAGIAQLARNLAVEWGPQGVRANAIAPGLVATAWADAILSDPDRADKRLGLTPLRRIAEPEEIAAVALFLASRAGGFVTGQTIVVDGGTMITDGN
jgi:NAD(P)-dependent dehydrogenase (short-subunit alcohol dehydrogenase family)